MYRPILVCLAAMLFAAGCASDGARASGDRSSDTGLPDTPTELAAYAGNAQYPADAPRMENKDLRAHVTENGQEVRIYNYGTENYRDVRIWVNGSYVSPLGGLASQSKAIIRTEKLYNQLGHTMASRREQPTRVEIQTADGIFNLGEPVVE